EIVVGIHGPIVLAEDGGVANGMLDRQSFLLVLRGPEEVEQGEALAIEVAADQSGVGRVSDHRRLHRAGCATDLRAQVRAGEDLEDLPPGAEEKHLVLDDGPANGAAKLLAMKVLERLAVGSIGGERFQALEMEERAVQIVGAGFGDDVDHAAAAAAELGAGPSRHHLKFLDRVERDVDSGALPT